MYTANSCLIERNAISMTLPDQARIMAVDDEVDIVFVIRRYLEKWGFGVDTFTDPIYALETFKAHPGRYSIAFLDIRMPEMTGITLANRMLKIKPDMNIVIMTAYEVTPDELHEHLPTISHNDILQKPFRLVQICGAVKKHLEVRNK